MQVLVLGAGAVLCVLCVCDLGRLAVDPEWRNVGLGAVEATVCLCASAGMWAGLCASPHGGQ